jgi:hypothetical protein
MNTLLTIADWTIRSRTPYTMSNRRMRPKSAPTISPRSEYSSFSAILKEFSTERQGGAFIFGKKIAYVDLSLFQMIEGLRYAFPKSMARLEPQHPRTVTLHDRVVARPESPPTYPHRGDWRSTSKTFSTTIPSWKRDKRKRVEAHKTRARRSRTS